MKYLPVQWNSLSAVIVAVSILLLLMPLFAATHWPLLDAPAHEARLAVLHDLAFSKSHMPFYNFDTFFLPNVAFDLIGFPLVTVFSPETAGKIVFGITLLATITGIAVLNRVVIGRWSPAPFASALAAYHLVAILGFFSYTLGLALVFWLLALRIKLTNAAPIFKHLIGSAGATILLFCHLFDFGIYSVMFGGFSLSLLFRRQIKLSHAIMNGVELLPAALMYLFMGSMEGTHPPNTFSIISKMFGVIKAMSSGSITADLAFLTGAACYIILLVRELRVRLSTHFVPGLAILVALYFVLPNRIASGAYIDSRMPIAILFLLLAGLDFQWRERRKEVRVLIGAIVAALVVKQVAITNLWQSFTGSIDQVSTALNSLPVGSVIFTSECKPADDTILGVYYSRQPAMTHLASLAAFQNTRFVAGVFALKGQQPIRVSQQFLPYYQLQQKMDATCDVEEYSARFARIRALQDRLSVAEVNAPNLYLFLIRAPRSVLATAPAKLISKGVDFALYKIVPKSAVNL